MALAGDGKRAVRDAAVRRLVELGKAGPLSRAQVAQVAVGLGVSDRTVWRWVAQASGQVKPVARPQFTLDEVLRKRLAFWRGNVSALHREILADAAVSGSPAPSLATLHRAVREGLAPAERAALGSDESGTIEVVDASTAAGGVAAQADQTGQEPVSTLSEDRMVRPDPGQATTLDDLVQQLRSLKIWAGSPSYETIKDRVNRAWAAAGRPDAELAGKTTVVDCFRLGRRRVNADLLVAIVLALHPDVGYVAQWRQALQVVGAETAAAAQVRVQDTLPPDLAGFTGRATELDRLRRVLGDARRGGGTAVISAIEGMAGVGKTQLAIHAAHLLLQEQTFDQVLFVNLRGFHPDPTQPPADPAAVLDGFLRLLGVPGQRIPHDLKNRVALYRDVLSDVRALVVLDNAATADQVRPLLPQTPDCRVLVTSRRNLSDLHPATYLTVDVFDPTEAAQFLTTAAPQIPLGDDPGAAARIAQRCGYLPLALGLVAGRIRAKPGWTLTDHAGWLDERHSDRRLDTGVELALDLSYQHLPDDRRRLLRLLALHPGHDLDAYAAAALADTDLDTARAHLDLLRGDHLLQQVTPGRYTFHDLVRAYATTRAHDEDRPPDRRAATSRLAAWYHAAAVRAAEMLYPYTLRLPGPRPSIEPSAMPFADGAKATSWLDGEQLNLSRVIRHSASTGDRERAWSMVDTLRGYVLLSYPRESNWIDVGQAGLDAAVRDDNVRAQAAMCLFLGVAECRLHHHAEAIRCNARAADLASRSGWLDGQAAAVIGKLLVQWLIGDTDSAKRSLSLAVQIYRSTGNRAGEAVAMANLAEICSQTGELDRAREYLDCPLPRTDSPGYLSCLAGVLARLGTVEYLAGNLATAEDLLNRVVRSGRHNGNRECMMLTHISLAGVLRDTGRHADALVHGQAALDLSRHLDDPYHEACALTTLGAVHNAAGDGHSALGHHRRALGLARDHQFAYPLATALTGLTDAYLTLDDAASAREAADEAIAVATRCGYRILARRAVALRRTISLATEHDAAGQEVRPRR